jgi:hypothetical protein
LPLLYVNVNESAETEQSAALIESSTILDVVWYRWFLIQLAERIAALVYFESPVASAR